VRRAGSIVFALHALACGASGPVPVVAPAEPEPEPTRQAVGLVPGTDLPDTPEARAIVEVLERYRVAFKNADGDALLALASPSYYDDAGTPGSEDDIDRGGLAASLARRRDVHLVDLALRYRAFSHQGNRILVDLDYEMVFEIDGRTSTRVTSNRVVLEPHDGTYLFVSGR
jgi:hypothetical protein